MKIKVSQTRKHISDGVFLGLPCKPEVLCGLLRTSSNNLTHNKIILGVGIGKHQSPDIRSELKTSNLKQAQPERLLS